jgi:hypothetical protein
MLHDDWNTVVSDLRPWRHIETIHRHQATQGLALTVILLALCNMMIWFTIKPGRNPYSLRMFLGFTVVICIGYFFIWFYWQGRNWARLAVLSFSILSILNLALGLLSLRLPHF